MKLQGVPKAWVSGEGMKEWRGDRKPIKHISKTHRTSIENPSKVYRASIETLSNIYPKPMEILLKIRGGAKAQESGESME